MQAMHIARFDMRVHWTNDKMWRRRRERTEPSRNLSSPENVLCVYQFRWHSNRRSGIETAGKRERERDLKKKKRMVNEFIIISFNIVCCCACFAQYLSHSWPPTPHCCCAQSSYSSPPPPPQSLLFVQRIFLPEYNQKLLEARPVTHTQAHTYSIHIERLGSFWCRKEHKFYFWKRRIDAVGCDTHTDIFSVGRSVPTVPAATSTCKIRRNEIQRNGRYDFIWPKHVHKFLRESRAVNFYVHRPRESQFVRANNTDQVILTPT